MALRFAHLMMRTCSIECPYCGEPVINTAGEEQFDADDLQRFERDQPIITCNSCDKKFRVVTQPKTQICYNHSSSNKERKS